jgi:hypothetical protein
MQSGLGARTRFCSLLGIIILAFAFTNLAHAQEVVTVSVRSYGQGQTEAGAIKDAIVQAVGQVTGERISASTNVSTRSVESIA